MYVSPVMDAPADQAPSDDPKDRRCLRCNAMFPSTWSGERICSHCKSTAAWRNGAPRQSQWVRSRR